MGRLMVVLLTEKRKICVRLDQSLKYSFVGSLVFEEERKVGGEGEIYYFIQYEN